MKQIKVYGGILATIVYAATISASCENGAFTPVPGQPFGAGADPQGVAFSPLLNGSLYAAVANTFSTNISVFQVDTTTGVFSSAGTFGATNAPSNVIYSPIVSGNLFVAVPLPTINLIEMFQVDTNTGSLTSVGTFGTLGNDPTSFAFSPIVNGNLFAAAANTNSDNLITYQVNTTTGSLASLGTIGTGTNPFSVAFSPVINGKLYAAAANSASNNISVYQVNTSSGAFSSVGTFPISGGSVPLSITFSPILPGNLLFAAVANEISGNVVIFSVNPSSGAFSQIQTITTVGTLPRSIAYSPLIAGNLFAAAVNNGSNNVIIYSVDITTGMFTQIPGPLTSAGTGAFSIAYSSLTPSNNLFAAVANNAASGTVSVFQVDLLFPVITTPSIAIQCSHPITINATIIGGTAPFTVVWSDGFTQTGAGPNFSRVVNPQVSSQFQIISVTDADGCTAGPSNAVTITVTGNACCNG